jgi:RNA polymerase sigma-70 factor (ECF subfamily)
MDCLYSNDTLFLQLYNDYYGKIYAYCRKRLNGRHEMACDCVQNTFFAVFQNITTLRTHENIAGWLYKTANNYVQLAIRQIKREQKEVRFSDLSENIPSHENFVADFEEKSVTLNVSSGDILQSLLENERQLHEMFYIKGLSTQEIADALGISDGACRTRLHRLRIKIYEKVRIAAGE